MAMPASGANKENKLTKFVRFIGFLLVVMGLLFLMGGPILRQQAGSQVLQNEAIKGDFTVEKRARETSETGFKILIAGIAALLIASKLPAAKLAQEEARAPAAKAEKLALEEPYKERKQADEEWIRTERERVAAKRRDLMWKILAFSFIVFLFFGGGQFLLNWLHP